MIPHINLHYQTAQEKQALREVFYHFLETGIGRIICAFSSQGLIRADFVTDEQSALEALQKCYPNALLKEKLYQEISTVAALFKDNIKGNISVSRPMNLCVEGSLFQYKVWQALLTLPFGDTASYSDIATKIKKPKAIRAVASAIGKNPIAFLIPCHRIIRRDGALGGYKWGLDLKQKLLNYERK